ncbi:MAG: RsmD family RNA methyltransferase [Bdellovibrionaceae bacterium]|nr:RsmD family RNA methyltransferase [Bdellovibrionales bacterium]MCB9255002.1 RsmD family RNA methyltransferase [Pseudobdellovibrionaceae bacterium]
MKSRRDPPDLRPITGRALRSVLDSLRPDLPERRVLDLYSGKGRFGFGALEEGAAHVDFVEKHPRVASELKKAAERWKDRSTVHVGDVLHWTAMLREQGKQFHVVFADPPFRLWDAEFAERLVSGVHALLMPEAIFLVRYPKRMVVSLPVYGLQKWKSSIFGESELLYLVKQTNS